MKFSAMEYRNIKTREVAPCGRLLFCFNNFFKKMCYNDKNYEIFPAKTVVYS